MRILSKDKLAYFQIQFLAQFQRLGRFMGMARQLTQTQTSNLSNMLSFWTTTPKTQHQKRFSVIYSNK